MSPHGRYDWPVMAELVLAQLESLTGRAEKHAERLSSLETGQALLAFKVSLWGALAGVGGACAVLLIRGVSK